MNIVTRFDPQQAVSIDGGADIKGHITAITMCGANIRYEVAWLHNGTAQWGTFDEWRLGEWEG